jgi:hypothetical protein
LNALHGMIDHCTQEREVPTGQRVVNQVICKRRTSREFGITMHIGEYDMDNAILKLGSNLMFLPKQT